MKLKYVYSILNFGNALNLLTIFLYVRTCAFKFLVSPCQQVFFLNIPKSRLKNQDNRSYDLYVVFNKHSDYISYSHK